MKQIASRIDQPDCFFLRENDRQLARCPWIRHFFYWVVPLQCLAEEKTQGSRVVAKCPYAQLAILQQIELILPDLVWPELVRWSLEMLRKIRDRPDVAGYGSL